MDGNGKEISNLRSKVKQSQPNETSAVQTRLIHELKCVFPAINTKQSSSTRIKPN